MREYSERETRRKNFAFLLILFNFLIRYCHETIKIVSDTAYAPFEFKDSDQTYKELMLLTSRWD